MRTSNISAAVVEMCVVGLRRSIPALTAEHFLRALERYDINEVEIVAEKPLKLLKIKDVSSFLQVTSRMIYTLIAEGEIKKG